MTESTGSLRADYPSGVGPSEIARWEAIVVLPTLNEVEGLEKTYPTIPLADLRRAGHRVGVVVIDGGSKDGTLEVAKRLGLVVLHQATRGKGSAVREALAWAAERGVPYALVMDADCTYPAEMIGPALTLLKAGGQVVVGVRNPVQTKPFGPRDIVHRVGNALLNWMASQTTGQAILDLCSGFYAIDLRTRLHEGLDATGFEIEAEMFLKAYLMGLKVVQIPISYHERVGVAKLRAVHDGGRIFVSILRSRQRASTPPPFPPASASLARELLSACFVHGSRELVVLAHPTRLEEARTVVRQLEGTRFAHALVVAEPERPEVGPEADPTDVSLAAAWPHAAVLHLGAKAEKTAEFAPSAMYLPNTRRFIRLDFDRAFLPESTELQGTEAYGEYARSGARRRPGRASRYVTSLTSLGSALDTSGFGKELVLHGANGLRGRALRADEVPAAAPAGAAPGPLLGSEEPARSTGGSSS